MKKNCILFCERTQELLVNCLLVALVGVIYCTYSVNRFVWIRLLIGLCKNKCASLCHAANNFICRLRPVCLKFLKIRDITFNLYIIQNIFVHMSGGGWEYLCSFICLSAGVVERQSYCFVITVLLHAHSKGASVPVLCIFESTPFKDHGLWLKPMSSILQTKSAQSVWVLISLVLTAQEKLKPKDLGHSQFEDRLYWL